MDDLGRSFDTKRIRQMVADHIAGRANYTDEIDKLMTLTLVARTLLKAPEPRPIGWRDEAQLTGAPR